MLSFHLVMYFSYLLTAFALFHGTSALVITDSPMKLAFHDAEKLQTLYEISLQQFEPSLTCISNDVGNSIPIYPCIALGASASGWAFAVDVSNRSRNEFEVKNEAEGNLRFEPVRALLATLNQRDIAMAGLGASTLAWHRQHQFCGLCGSRMVAVEAGGRRACTSETCRNRAYPRVDPVVIALVQDPVRDKILLGRQSVYRPMMYSCLAGYVGPCESLEEAVRREVKEESGIDVGEMSYHSSQPWPIGRGASCQMMVGFTATATSTEIHIDTNELEDCRWFSRAEVAEAEELVVARRPGPSDESSKTLSIPGPYAIAHHLIKNWLSTTKAPLQASGRNKL